MALLLAPGSVSSAQAQGITIVPTAGLVTFEDPNNNVIGTATTFTVVLDTQPTANVSIDLSIGDVTEGIFTGPSQGFNLILNFTPANFATPQTVTVSGIGDGLNDGDVTYTINTGPVFSGDAGYNGLDPTDVTVTNRNVNGVVLVPEMRVTGNGVEIADGDTTPDAGDHTSFTTVATGQPGITRTYTIHNDGTGVLSLGANAVSITGLAANTSRYTINSQPATSLAPGETTSFSITYAVPIISPGTHPATVVIANNDGDESPYNFAITGVGAGAPTVTRSYAANSILVGHTTTVRYAFINQSATTAFIDGDITDTLPAGLRVSNFPQVTPAGDCAAGTVTAGIGASFTRVFGLSVPAAGVCTIDISVTAQAAGILTATTTDFTYTFPGSAATFAVPGITHALEVIGGTDFGDAPASYGTTLAGNGARHDLTSLLRLGASVDDEADGQPNATATGDTGDDGVALPAVFRVGQTETVNVTASAAGVVNAWIDWNADGTFGVGEQVLTDAAVGAGANAFNIAVPATIASGTSFARFRINAAGGLGPTGPAGDGEVEDYQVTLQNDTTPPVLLSFLRQNPTTETTTADTLIFRAMFSEAVRNVDAADFLPTGTTATITAVTAVSASVYEITVTGGNLAGLNGVVGLDLAAGQNITDLDGNVLPGGEPATDETYRLESDTTPPTVEILGAPKTVSYRERFAITIQFSEPVTGFQLADITVGHGAASDFVMVDADTYTAIITASGSGDVTIDVNQGVAEDLAGNLNLAAEQVVVKSTVVAETVEIIGHFVENRARLILESQPDMRRRIDRLNGTIRNDGGVSGFGLAYQSGDLPVSMRLSEREASFSYSWLRSQAAGSAPSFTADTQQLFAMAGIHFAPVDPVTGMPRDGSSASADRRSSYGDARQQPANDNVAEPSAPAQPSAGQAQAGTPHDRQASASVSPSRDDVDPLLGYADGLGTSADQGETGPDRRIDFWAEGRLMRYDIAAGSGNFSIVHAGMDYRFWDAVLIGIGGQLDWTTFDGTGAATVDGFGFMIGPYMTARLTDRFFIDARAAWGQSHNTISPFGTYADDFDGERSLVTAALIGDFDLGAFNLVPELRLAWFSEETDAYVDSLGNTIPSIDVELGTLEFGPTLSRRLPLGDGLMATARINPKGIWTFAAENSAQAFALNPQTLAQEGLRASIEGGIDFANDNDLTFSLSGSYDGLGDDAFEAIGVKARLNYRW